MHFSRRSRQDTQSAGQPTSTTSVGRGHSSSDHLTCDVGSLIAWVGPCPPCVPLERADGSIRESRRLEKIPSLGSRATRRFPRGPPKILTLYEVDSAFVQDKAVSMTVVFDIQTVRDTATREALFELPHRVGELYRNMFPDSLWFPINQVPLVFDDARVACSKLMSKEFIPVKVPYRCKILTTDQEWTRQDGRVLSHAVNRDEIENLELTVHSARELAIALEVFVSLNSTETVAISMKIGKHWDELFPSGEDPPLDISSTPPRKLQLVTLSGPEDMTRQVEAILNVLNMVGERVRDVVLSWADIHLKTRVLEAKPGDFSIISPLLGMLGERLTSLEMDSCSNIENFHAEVDSILLKSPNLRLLAVQSASRASLPELYERGETRLGAFRVQSPARASAIELMQHLGDSTTAISQHLIEFSTRRNEKEFQFACLDTLRSSTRLRYLRLGRGNPSDTESCSLTSQLLAHHSDRLWLSPAMLGIMISQVANVITLTKAERIDDAVVELIADYVGGPVYRQVVLW